MQPRERHAGLRGDLPGARVDRSERVEAAQVEHDLAVQRHRAADEPGVPALRDDRGARVARTRAAPPRPRRPCPGRTTAGVEPENRPVQSRTWPATTSGSVSTCASPTAVAQARRASDGGPQSPTRAYGGAKIRSVADPIPESLRGRLLVATPPLVDPNFDRTVVLMLEHGEEGALGIVLNRPTDASLGVGAARVARARVAHRAWCSAAARSRPKR